MDDKESIVNDIYLPVVVIFGTDYSRTHILDHGAVSLGTQNEGQNHEISSQLLFLLIYSSLDTPEQSE